MATNVDRVLRYRVFDKESGQLVAGFSSEPLADRFAELYMESSDRIFYVVDARG
jgi:hypothetical protein